MRTWVAEMHGVECPICTLSGGNLGGVNLPPPTDDWKRADSPHPLGVPLQRAPIDHPQVRIILDELVDR
jgi:hypothetical protein